ncbi:hypothetical protein BIWAKO_06526 [Bosea sp. BIWAKO-01]|nr:hypothetical protein BIWAKO_06526 [Bosea sp. BIWAKO-01]
MLVYGPPIGLADHRIFHGLGMIRGPIRKSSQTRRFEPT